MVKASARIGSIGFSVNVANALVAIFTATGQDIACVVEGTSADLILEPLPGSNYHLLNIINHQSYYHCYYYYLFV